MEIGIITIRENSALWIGFKNKFFIEEKKALCLLIKNGFLLKLTDSNQRILGTAANEPELNYLLLTY